MKWWIILIIVLVLLVLWVINTYNKLIALRNRVKDQWAQIDVQLKRRFDLIPNLVETVKGYTKHESETLEAVIKARNTYVTAGTPEAQMKADGELTQAISKLFALTESYPDLKANTNFQHLQEELTQTESKIASARQFYNDTVMLYNNKVSMVPSNIIASLFKFNKEAFFEANETERQNVSVKF
ncbi:lemA family protein [Clostridium sp. CAG:609]|nr:lemA family protein [Clostridium sp. CAG:609]